MYRFKFATDIMHLKSDHIYNLKDQLHYMEKSERGTSQVERRLKLLRSRELTPLITCLFPF